MTTINPMRPFGTNAVVVKSDINDAWTYLGAAGHYKTADLAAALGLVTREEMEEFALKRNRIANERDAWKVRAEAAERMLAEAQIYRDHYRAERDGFRENRDALRAELDEAKATIARVRHLRDVSGDTVGVDELDAALDPKPAFVLPTEVPARIWADDKLGNEHTFTLFADGNGGSTWSHDCAEADADDDEFYSGVRLMHEFTGHCLIGAES